MVEILVPGTLKRIKCEKCGALLRYDKKEDVKEEENMKKKLPLDSSCIQKFIVCPQCQNKIILAYVSVKQKGDDYVREIM